jgi:hypothetical protein
MLIKYKEENFKINFYAENRKNEYFHIKMCFGLLIYRVFCTQKLKSTRLIKPDILQICPRGLFSYQGV